MLADSMSQISVVLASNGREQPQHQGHIVPRREEANGIPHSYKTNEEHDGADCSLVDQGACEPQESDQRQAKIKYSVQEAA